MPREIFGSGSTYHGFGNRQWYTLPLAVLTHTTVIGVLLVVPLLAANALPTPQAVLTFAARLPAPVPPPPPAPPPTTPPPTPTVAPDPSLAPTEAPTVIGPELPPAFTPTVGIRPGPESVAAGPAVSLAGPPPAPTPTKEPTRVGGDVKEPRKIHDVIPIYPSLARAARTEGTVILEATIAKDGTVREVKLLRSVALLDEAAMAAVRQWRYTVPTLNGEPIDVLMTVTVRFSLAR